MKAVAALRWALCADSSQVPPPTLPVDGAVSPDHWGIGAAAIWCAGVLKVPWKTEPPYQDGPASIRTLRAWFLSKAELKTLLSDMVLFLISVSSSDAIRVQFGPLVSTVTALGPVTWLAPHLLAHM